MNAIHPPKAADTIDRKVIDRMKLNSRRQVRWVGELTAKDHAGGVMPDRGRLRRAMCRFTAQKQPILFTRNLNLI